MPIEAIEEDAEFPVVILIGLVNLTMMIHGHHAIIAMICFISPPVMITIAIATTTTSTATLVVSILIERGAHRPVLAVEIEIGIRLEDRTHLLILPKSLSDLCYAWPKTQ